MDVIMFKVDIEFKKNNKQIEPILEWIFANTVGRFHTIGDGRYWFFEFELDAKKFEDKWYEIPYENYIWKKTEYECVESKITSKVHHIILYYPEKHDSGIKWKMFEWCEENIGPYAGVWYYSTKSVSVEGFSGDISVADVLCFSNKEDAAYFKLTWA